MFGKRCQSKTIVKLTDFLEDFNFNQLDCLIDYSLNLTGLSIISDVSQLSKLTKLKSRKRAQTQVVKFIAKVSFCVSLSLSTDNFRHKTLKSLQNYANRHKSHV